MRLNVFRPFKCTIHMIHLFFFVSEPPEIIKATEPDRTLDRICREFDDFVKETGKKKIFDTRCFDTESLPIIYLGAFLRRENKVQVARAFSGNSSLGSGAAASPDSSTTSD